MPDKTLKPKLLNVKVATKEIDGERTVVFVASSQNVDRDAEIVDVKSLRLPLKGGNYIVASQLTGNENVDIPFLIDHSWSVENVIGSVRKAYLNESGELIFEAGISNRDKAQDLLTLLEEKHLDNAFSISMYDYDYSENTIYNAEVVEVSLVWRGSNKDARLLAVKSLFEGDKMPEEEIKPEVAEEVKPEVAEEVKEEVVEPEVVEEVKPAEEPKVEEVEEKKLNKETKMSKEKEIAQAEIVEPASQEVASKEVELDKYEFTAKQFVAWVNKDAATLAELNKKAIESYSDLKNKETYLNAGTVADGGAIVPNAQLLTEVYSILANYSSVADDIRVITLTEGDSLDVATLLADVVISEVATEGGDKAVTKPTFGDGEISLREFAGIAIMTKKLVRQAAVNVYNIIRDSFARAIAAKRAEMALTDATSGIVTKLGVNEVYATGTDIADYTWADVKKMPYAVPASTVQGGKYYISRELLETLDTAQDSMGRDLDIVTLSGNGLTGTFKNGFAFAVEESLGKDGAPHAVFGAMGRYGILLRQSAVEAQTFDSGIVKDGASVEHNLIQQNKLAYRVAFYENVGYPIPQAFAILLPAQS